MIYLNHAEVIDPAPYSETIYAAIGSSMAHFGLDENKDLTIYLTNDDEISVLNKTWMGKDGATDVLSFPSEETDPDSGNEYLGDIVISIERTVEQSVVNGNTNLEECTLLAIHGLLHLLGFDHYTEEEKKEMWFHQSAILDKLGMGHIAITE